ncbi:Glutamate-gated chloride channel [Fasciolopsis buskii]|uniref:Glutamate-gated chloride channel n=1 Tax=Fasciolopsis buskii TaxID=27845 RepID=A0A8E0S122_9TREM|nr:Glutamate-gated chloride channel [Fasciolopsis buski]
MDTANMSPPRPKTNGPRDCTKNGTTSTGTYSCLLLTLPLQRLVSSYLVTTYIPEVLIVMVSWLGFWIDVRAVPARISLGLLTLLGLLTEGSSVGSKLPRVTYIKAIDVWIIACLLFVVAALAEFAAAYMLAPQEKNNEWDDELRQLIRRILAKKLGDSHCCCCYTKCTDHKPVLFTSRSGHPPDTGNFAGSGGGRARGGARVVRNESLPTEYFQSEKPRKPNTPSSLSKCGLCDSLQPSCCTCPLCSRLQCPKAPRTSTVQTSVQCNSGKYKPVPLAVEDVTDMKSANTCTGNSADRRHIVICEPSPTFRRQAVVPKRIGTGPRNTSSGSFPKKSALKVSRSPNTTASFPRERNRSEMRRSQRMDRSYLSKQSCSDAKTTPCSTTTTRKQRLLFNSRYLFRFTRLKCGTPSSPNERLLMSQSVAGHAVRRSTRTTASATTAMTTNQTAETYDSEVDAYSRFLFPACFVLFNCCYWLFYLVIVDDHPPKLS